MASEKPIYKQVGEYLDYCYARQMTEQTMTKKVYTLQKFIGLGLVDDMTDCTNQVINRWIAMQSSGAATGNRVSGRTINGRLDHIVAFAKYLRDMGYTIPITFRLIEKVREEPPRRTWFTKSQVEAAMDGARPMAKLLIALTFDSGIRATELRNLRLSNINGRRIDIIGKGRKAGTLFITERTRRLMDDWIKSQGITGCLWPSPAHDDGRPYSVDQLRCLMRKEFERAGIPGFYLHAMRHSFATDLQLSGASDSQAQKLMRHSNIATTQIYLHAFDNGMMSVYDQLKSAAV